MCKLMDKVKTLILFDRILPCWMQFYTFTLKMYKIVGFAHKNVPKS